ncbi:MAG TPA: hypothetical protein VFI82_07370 [Terriglobales bacterium]|nr:hypothetical protein [Terriglobales bacterium]
MSSHVLDRDYVHVLSLLTLGRHPQPSTTIDPVAFVAGLNAAQRDELLQTAQSHHVVVRAFARLQQDAALAAQPDVVTWAGEVTTRERERIDHALPFLDSVCQQLNTGGCATTVIKSLDHWPDLGSDLDLYTTASEHNVVRIMRSKLKAQVEPRSWGDRLAQKWNFTVPGLPESVEIHCRRLGQTGEHTALAERFVSRRVYRTVSGQTFPVPAPEERIIVATLQRMYRHFYFRLSDILNTAALLDAASVNFDELRTAAELGGIWSGVATYLRLVCDYAGRYRGVALELPRSVRDAALFGGNALFVRDCFIRLPVIPHGAKLYTRQVTRTALRGDVPATLRLSLLPPLASVAALAFKITGSDKGIW